MSASRKRLNLEPEYVSTPDAAQLLGMSIAWLERARWQGDGPKFVRIGRGVRYRLADLRQFMNDRLRVSTTDTPRPRRKPSRALGQSADPIGRSLPVE